MPSGLTLEPCTVLCRTVVSVSLWEKSWPLLDQFAFCESLRECFSLGDSPKTHHSSFIPFLWGPIISLARKFGTSLSYRIPQHRFSFVLNPYWPWRARAKILAILIPFLFVQFLACYLHSRPSSRKALWYYYSTVHVMWLIITGFLLLLFFFWITIAETETEEGEKKWHGYV